MSWNIREKAENSLRWRQILTFPTIGTGLKRNGMPQADLALRIAKALNVPIEYLVGNRSNDFTNVNKKTVMHEWIELVAKYKKVLTALELMPERTRSAIVRMIEEIG